ncbi:Eco57I restriction-modification methylase domain-containing protein [Helcococcus sueciensis]|uniref:Eco57I restriction-modification methylase domain-containing protein n=1 Tax=Helcococcus sueciensis TaxID=241555 RepID=UPI00040ACD06|nr:Eco57I restriction-modification methylase domain-containing protein [Helcococcus sueciensis]
MKFDVIVGNPPYQELTRDTSDNPIYHYFYDLGFEISNKVLLISPARFLFNAGKTPKNWNKKMLDDENLKVVYYEQKSSKVFPLTDIKGGVAVLYRDKEKKLGPIGIFTVYNELNDIIKKVTDVKEFKSIKDLIILQNRFNLDALYEDFPSYKSIVGSNGKERRLTTPIFTQLDIFTEGKRENNDVKIYGLINNKRTYRWVNRKYLEEHDNIDKYKVLVPKSNGSGVLGEVLSSPIVAEPGLGFTFTFISFGAFNNQIEANNLLKYIKTKFARLMLGVLKITQDNLARTWSYVPLQDFTNKSDIDWSKSIPEIDQQLYKKYNLSDKEINFIEEKVKAME